MYKILENGILKDNLFIPKSADNNQYNQFIKDIALGNDTVEGPDVHEPSYVELRQAEYPPMSEQLDMQYHDNLNGTTIWADTIQAIKEKYPKTLTGGVTVGDVPTWVQEEADAWLFQKQLTEYKAAVKRLEQYTLLEGREEIREMQPTGEQVFNEESGEMEDVLQEVVVQSLIEPLQEFVEVTVYGDDPETPPTTQTVRNPLVVQDEAEREQAQSVIDATPENVKNFEE